MNSFRSQTLFLALALIAVPLFFATGCFDTRYTIRDVDQHHGGQFNTIQTFGEQVLVLGPLALNPTPVGLNYWNCEQSGSEVVCERVCDENWTTLCRPELRHEFGTISRPNAGVAVARFARRSAQEQDQEWETGLHEAEEDDLDGEVATEEDGEATEEGVE